MILFSTFGIAQSNFKAVSTGDTGGSISTHFDTCSSNEVINSAISTSTSCGFTSPAVLTNLHLGGKDYAINPDAGVVNLGGVQFSTGLFLNGDLNGVALFDSANLSYVSIYANGSCGQFKNDGVTCKPNGFVPNGYIFVGVFVGTISWNTLIDGSHTLSGTVMGVINNKGNPVFLSFVATTVPESHPAFQNGHERIGTVSLEAF